MKIFKEILPYIIVAVVVILIRTFIVTPVIVNGESMEPTLIENEILLLRKYDKNYKRFDIVVIEYEKDKIVKRVIGLPGDHISFKNNNLYVNGKKMKENFKHNEVSDFDIEDLGEKVVPKDSYFVVGDNRPVSKDSRIIGFIKKDQIKGKTGFVLFPFNRFGNKK